MVWKVIIFMKYRYGSAHTWIIHIYLYPFFGDRFSKLLHIDLSQHFNRHILRINAVRRKNLPSFQITEIYSYILWADNRNDNLYGLSLIDSESLII